MSFSHADMRKKLIWEVLTSWPVLAPFAIGATILLFAWGLSLKGLIAGVIGVAFIVVSLVTFFGRLAKDEGIKQRVVAKIQRDLQREERKRLDELDYRLTLDRDPRTQMLLRNLRGLRNTFAGCSQDQNCERTAGTIIAGVEDLFANSVRALETTLVLKETANGLLGEEAKAPLMERRDRLIDDVEITVQEMSKIIGGLQVISATDDNGVGSTDELRQSLSEKLSAIKRTQEEMAQLQVGI